ncbi:MAG: response regulator receiver [Fusobacteria bacterium]|nr:MAG: response regulator receiver [Fusobacteriota bacterium]KAF0230230.1 MAG: response regulator [Fusobacteriota bacterium]
MKLKIDIRIDEKTLETTIIVQASKIDEEITEIINKLKEIENKNRKGTITGFKDDIVEIIDENKIIRIYSSMQKVMAETSFGTYLIKSRLYELEERLDKNNFVRISNSEIINLKRVVNFDLSFSGTICVNLDNKETTYVSRRFVSKIKEVLGI